ncbi:MAG: hypothetical protein Q7T93_21525 [Methylobacterium sp.]|jgi:hypothetical protein|nr:MULTISPECIES: hypothetical protein [unclassified Methylobacterium]MDO9429389.1 hypothetical protein [Methylobacterium sp.]
MVKTLMVVLTVVVVLALAAAVRVVLLPFRSVRSLARRRLAAA